MNVAPEITQEFIKAVADEISKSGDVYYTIIFIGFTLSIALIGMLIRVFISNKLDKIIDKKWPTSKEVAAEIIKDLKYPTSPDLAEEFSTIFSGKLEDIKKITNELKDSLVRDINDYPTGIKATLGKLEMSLVTLLELLTKIDSNTIFIKEEVVKLGYILKIFKSSISNDDIS